MVIGSRIRKRLLLAFTAACIAILLAQTIIRQLWILPTFEAMTKQNDRIDIQRVESQLQQEIDALSKMVFDSSAWDTMYVAAYERDTQWFNDDYVIADALQRLDVNGWYLYDTQANIIGGGSFNNDYLTYSPKILETSHLLKENDLIVLSDDIANSQSALVHKVRFITIDKSPVLTIAYNVTKSDGSGKFVGTLLLWSFIDEGFVENLTPGLANDIRFYGTDEVFKYKDHLTRVFGDNRSVMGASQHNRRLYLGVNDQKGNLLFVLSIKSRERTYDRSLFDSSLITGLFISGSVFVLFYLYINQQVLKPLRKLYTLVNSAISNNDFSARDEYYGDNELHQLGRGMNELFTLIENQREEIFLRHEKLNHISNTDSMTELANRRALDKHFAKLASDAVSAKQPISLIVADIDHFKLYNDFYGHDQGDKALCEVANLLKDNTNPDNHFVARYGGEEFVIVLSNTDKQEALKVAETLRNAVESAHITHQGREDLSYVTLSIGVASKVTNEAFDSDSLFKIADNALYKAKKQGRNCCVAGDKAQL
ncbi:diguanylate cyclase [Pseudoalteromonas sp. HF66]|uniref:sensor domain-containing diguanylate cyclase n=1 Tax=Pseudoalteromonas sp. HF66 TaxID=2721559 RepID=UPI001431D1C0|nr:diguanylate cyclase [Pseudoalteromonas sp. HF66]NIZ05411.1 diguanylate cyclase [Pseudoalteromonas sp. HF66]